MRPKLIPHEFTVRQAKRKFYAKRAQRTWWQWFAEHRYSLCAVGAALMVGWILLIKYREQQKRRHLRLQTQSPN